MQRQSLGGSPVSKLHHPAHGGPKDQTLIAADTASAAASTVSAALVYKSDDDHKASRPHRLSSPPPLIAPHKSIHVIPVLTLLCFLVLFLFSHSPSQSDLAQFNGFTKPSAKRIDFADIGEIGEIGDVRKSGVLAIRSLRNLQDTQTRKLGPRSRSLRKIDDF